MRFKIVTLLLLIFSTPSFSQCFDCGQSIGDWVDDHARDLDKTSDGLILSSSFHNTGYGLIQKYDFNCNLIWSLNLETDIYGSELDVYDTAVDENDNIYAIIIKATASNVLETLNGNPIPYGTNMIKIDNNGNVLWSRFIGGGGENIHYWNNHLFVVGQYYTSININNQINLSNSTPYNTFIAKFNTDGDLLDADQYGTGERHLLSSVVDTNGNIYLAGVVYISNAIINGHLTKVNANLEVQWSNPFGNNSSHAFPSNMYYNDTNNKLYIWMKYSDQVNVWGVDFPDGNCDTSSAVLEISTNVGSLDNYYIFQNCGPNILFGSGNGITDVQENGYMVHKDNKLYVLSAFLGNVYFDDINITSTTYNNNSSYNRDLVLYSIDLNDFSPNVVLTSTGTNYDDSYSYQDFPASILMEGDNIYMSATFMSYPMLINNVSISNNSGNNGRDVMFFKYKLDQTDLSNVISYETTCFNTETSFYLNGDFDSVTWNFDDPNSGINNTATIPNPSHTFSAIGNYTVTAIVTCGTETETLSAEVVITGTPLANQIADIYACEDVYGSQISSAFDTSSIEDDLIGNQAGLSITYHDSNGNELPSPLPNPMSNITLAQQTITARVAYNNNLTCYTEVSFNLLVNALPEIQQVNNLYVCDDSTDGIAVFDISTLESTIAGGQTGLTMDFFFENGQLLPYPWSNTIQNTVPYQETVTIRVTNPITECSNEFSFDLIVNTLPIANSLDVIYGCDDNNDGISEYFDTSHVESQVLNGQTGMTLSYFDQNENPLPSPLPDIFTNTNPFNEFITVRLTNSNTFCYAETILELQTVTQPIITQPNNLYACDLGNGYAEFDTSNIEQQIIGTQTGLNLYYYDASNNPLPSPLPQIFQNTEPYTQTLRIRVEDASNPICYSEVVFDLIVNPIPEINLNEAYAICQLEPNMSLNISQGFNTYSWVFEDSTLISSTNNAVITEEGNYTVTVTQLQDGITCEETFTFSLIRSDVPEIQQVKYGDLGNNFIEIFTSGDGDFEYSIDGIHYQDSNYFPNVPGGTYTVYVRDKNGCGEDSQEVTIIDYPRFFTPNNDGYNDYWQIKGIRQYPNSKIMIFDRYGKLIALLTHNDLGWDGRYNGKLMMSNDYWFSASLSNGVTFSGHFSLKR